MTQIVTNQTLNDEVTSDIDNNDESKSKSRNISDPKFETENKPP
jgi:hypothetical protein